MTDMAIRGNEYHKVRDALMYENEYKGGSALRITKGGTTDLGRLGWSSCPVNMSVIRDELRTARTVVWSYATPIGWVTQDGKVRVPPVSYSPTTSAHQSLTGGWLGIATHSDRSDLDMLKGGN